MRVTNSRNGTALADRCRLAETIWSRGRGLLFGPPLRAGEGLLIRPCNSVHTFMMGFAIDVLFLDRDGRVLHLIPAMPPRRASRIVWKAHSTLELPAGTAQSTDTRVGDALTFED